MTKKPIAALAFALVSLAGSLAASAAEVVVEVSEITSKTKDIVAYGSDDVLLKITCKDKARSWAQDGGPKAQEALKPLVLSKTSCDEYKGGAKTCTTKVSFYNYKAEGHAAAFPVTRQVKLEGNRNKDEVKAKIEPVVHTFKITWEPENKRPKK